MSNERSLKLRRRRSCRNKRQASLRDLRSRVWPGTTPMISLWPSCKTKTQFLAARGLAPKKHSSERSKTQSMPSLTVWKISLRVAPATIRILMDLRAPITFSQHISTSLTTWCASTWGTWTHEMSFKENLQKNSVNSQFSSTSVSIKLKRKQRWSTSKSNWQRRLAT